MVNVNGTEIEFEAVVNLMDDEIREELNSKMAPCDEQDFVDAYIAAHASKFDGEEFRVN